MGSITARYVEPYYVHHRESVAVVYNLKDNGEARDAIRGLMDSVLDCQDPDAPFIPQFFLVDEDKAAVYCFDRSKIQ